MTPFRYGMLVLGHAFKISPRRSTSRRPRRCFGRIVVRTFLKDFGAKITRKPHSGARVFCLTFFIFRVYSYTHLPSSENKTIQIFFFPKS